MRIAWHHSVTCGPRTCCVGFVGFIDAIGFSYDDPCFFTGKLTRGHPNSHLIVIVVKENGLDLAIRNAALRDTALLWGAWPELVRKVARTQSPVERDGSPPAGRAKGSRTRFVDPRGSVDRGGHWRKFPLAHDSGDRLQCVHIRRWPDGVALVPFQHAVRRHTGHGVPPQRTAVQDDPQNHKKGLHDFFRSVLWSTDCEQGEKISRLEMAFKYPAKSMGKSMGKSTDTD